MSRIHTDLSRVSVSVAPNPATSGTSLGVTDTNAAYLPNIYPWWGVLVPTGQAPTRSNSEIVKVTAGSSSGGTTTYTIVRAQGIPATTAQTVTTSFDIYDANSSESNTRVDSKIISTTRVGDANTADVSYTGIGFKPTYIRILLNVDNTSFWSVGEGDSSKQTGCIYGNGAGNIFQSYSYICQYSNQSAWAQNAIIKSFDNDGFTLTWTKIGTPTSNTCKIVIICIR
jgi:hypothetical protein